MCEACDKEMAAALEEVFGSTQSNTAQGNTAQQTLSESGYWCNATLGNGRSVQMTGKFVWALSGLVDAGAKFVDSLTKLTEAKKGREQARYDAEREAFDALREEAAEARNSQRERAGRLGDLLGLFSPDNNNSPGRGQYPASRL